METKGILLLKSEFKQHSRAELSEPCLPKDSKAKEHRNKTVKSEKNP